jgi:multiple sugar transport system ATP-binding protein
VPRAEIRRRVEETARLLRIDHLLRRGVGGLAGGDRQRVALGRAIVRRPKAFLMDEPLGTLDAAFRELMCEELRGLHDRIGATTVYVTHDQIEAMAMADRIAVMHDGRVLQAGPPQELYHRPRSLFVAGFLGSPAMNFLDCPGGLAAGAREVRLDGAPVTVPELREPASTERLLLGVRPEHVHLDDAAPLRGEVYGVEYMGARQIVTVDTPVGRLKVRTSNQARIGMGERVGLALDPARTILFDPLSERALASAFLPEAIGHG